MDVGQIYLYNHPNNPNNHWRKRLITDLESSGSVFNATRKCQVHDTNSDSFLPSLFFATLLDMQNYVAVSALACHDGATLNAVIRFDSQASATVCGDFNIETG